MEKFKTLIGVFPAYFINNCKLPDIKYNISETK